MNTDFYFWTAVVVAIATLIGGVFWVVNEADDAGDLVLLVIVAVLGAGMAGVMWPFTIVAGVVATGALVLRRSLARSEERTQEARRQPAPEGDADKYLRMAREQRDLARTHRRDAPDLAALHEAMAVQYEGLADLYISPGER